MGRRGTEGCRLGADGVAGGRQRRRSWRRSGGVTGRGEGTGGGGLGGGQRSRCCPVRRGRWREGGKEEEAEEGRWPVAIRRRAEGEQLGGGIVWRRDSWRGDRSTAALSSGNEAVVGGDPRASEGMGGEERGGVRP